MTLFREQGYHAVGIDRLLVESSVAKMTMYKYFTSKDALIEAVLEERDLRFRRSLTEYVGTFDAPKDKIKAVFLWHHQWFNEPSFHGCMFINAVAEFPETNSPIRQVSMSHKLLLQEFIQSILKSILTGKAAKRLSSQLLQLLDGATIAAQVAGDSMAAFWAWRSAAGLLLLDGFEVKVGRPF